MTRASSRTQFRRDAVVSGVLALAVVASVGVLHLARAPISGARVVHRPVDPPAVNPIVAENLKPGTSAWHIGAWAGRALEGYASATSVAPGDSLTLFVSSHYPTFSAVVYRMGWYNGAGARSVLSLPALHGRAQAAPLTDAQTRMVEARWSPTFDIRIGPKWTTGVYLLKLTAPDGKSNYVPFTVRELARRAPLVFQSSVTTWQAYNDWGGHNLYLGVQPGGGRTSRLRSTVVSFDRPYATGAGAGDFFYMEYALLRWFEEQGYDLAYVTSLDTHEDAALLTGRRGFLSMGHDEYWSTAMRGHVEDAIRSGVNFAFFGANAMYRHIRLENSPAGIDRREVNYRSARADPITATDPMEATVQWRDNPVRRPEDAVLGAMYECNPVHDDAVVYDPLPWLFAGTGLRTGDHVTKLIGREYDRVFHRPVAPRKIWLLFRSPVQCGGAASVADTTLTRFPSGALVFDAASQGFICAFGDCASTPPDQRVRRLVRNLLDSFLGRVITHDDQPRPFTIAPPHRRLAGLVEQRPQPMTSGEVRQPSTPRPARNAAPRKATSSSGTTPSPRPP